MKRHYLFIACAAISAFLLSGTIQAQDEPVLPPFETNTLIDNQTSVTPYKGSFSMEIQHRFAQIKEISDILGIFGSANTRIGFNYAITDKILVGLGTTRTNTLQDLEWKYNFLTQKQSWKMPFSMTYYGNVVLDARDSKYLTGYEDTDEGTVENYKFAYRLSYMHQLILSQRIGDWFSYQLTPTFVYFNAVPEGYRNENLSLNAGLRFQVLGFHSIILEYDQPLLQPTGGNAKTIYPNISLGLEIGTSTHSFRIFASNYNSIVKNHDVAFNDRNPLDGDFQFGFNITIRFR
jgi:hypothetical protein